MGEKIITELGGGELLALLQSEFPQAAGRLRRFRPYGRAELDKLLEVPVDIGPQITLHAFPGLRIGDHTVPPKFLRVSRCQAGIEVFRESDSGLKSVRLLTREEIIRFYYDLVWAGYRQAEDELTLNSTYPPAIVRGIRKEAPVVDPR